MQWVPDERLQWLGSGSHQPGVRRLLSDNCERREDEPLSTAFFLLRAPPRPPVYPYKKMAEVAVGLLGAAATVGASSLAAGSGFTARHEHSHREEMIETRRGIAEFMVEIQRGDVAQDDVRGFSDARKECVCAVHQLTSMQTNLYSNYRAIRRANEHYESIESYKRTSWLNVSEKLQKKKEVRRRKGLTRLANHSLRHLNEVRCCQFCPISKPPLLTNIKSKDSDTSTILSWPSSHSGLMRLSNDSLRNPSGVSF
jgi:hypothetical protein